MLDRVVSGDSSILEKWPGIIEDPNGALGKGFPPALQLPPLCHQRILCLRRTQLVNSVRKQRFYKQTTHFTGFLYSLETTQLIISKMCTYNGNYLFGIGYENEASENEAVKIIHFGKSTVTPENSFRLRDQMESYNVTITCEVIMDKLVVRQDELFKVYQINIPMFPPIHSINAQHGSSECKIILVRNIIFSENDFTKIINLWDVCSSQALGELVSSKEGCYLTIIGHSSEFQAVLFYSERRERAECAYILQYCTALMIFTEFSIKLDKLNTLIIPQIVGLATEKYNVVLIPRDSLHMSVKVYDKTLSILVCEKEFEDIYYSGVEGEFFSIRDCLALRSLTSIKIVLLSNLEILWEILFDHDLKFTGVYELPVLIQAECRYLNIANALHLIVLSTDKFVSFWDFALKRKLFELPAGCTDICVNDMCTKLIFRFPEKEELSVWSFGQV